MEWTLGLIGLILAALLIFLASCTTGREAPIADGYDAKTEAVFFDMKVDPDAEPHQWICSYKVRGTTAKFRLRIETAADSTTRHDGLVLKFGKGEFIPEAGSEPSALLADLGKAIEAKSVPTPVNPRTRVPFTYANLGGGLSLTPDGGFHELPPGGWTALKLFFGEGEQQAEVFLDFNTRIGKGRFSMKDPEYGDLVLAQLAKVL